MERQESLNSSGGSERVYENEHMNSDDEDDGFEDLLHTLGGDGLFEEVDVIKSLWGRIRRDEPELLGNFEDFLGRVTSEIKRGQNDLSSMEVALKHKSQSHEDEVKKLYEEMENQIRLEKERIISEEKTRERQMREEMEKELALKDGQLQELLSKQKQMEERLQVLNMAESETKQLNDALLKEKKELETMLDSSVRNLDDSRSYIDQLRKKHRDEKRERAMAALQITEGIALERESLVKQLDMLRDMNKRLRDDKDEAELRRALKAVGTSQSIDETDGTEEPTSEAAAIKAAAKVSHQQAAPAAGKGRRKLSKQGSIMSSYFSSDARKRSQVEGFGRDVMEGEIVRSGSTSPGPEPGSKREQPVGATSSTQVNESGIGNGLMAPERVFKIVFIGDSGVGKSSFIHRFCSGNFKATFSATIGVDFQVKSMVNDGHTIALQLWDTAGQERFRSITKQYFRKADGVVVVYDVTSESSFTNVRNWMNSVQDGVEEGTVLCLVGNKTDLCDGDDHRVVKTKDGAKLADTYESLFYECSAKSGNNVVECLEAMASLLREKEDRELEKILNLSEHENKKKSCC